MKKRIQSLVLIVTLLIGLLTPAATVNAETGVDAKLLEKCGFELPIVTEVPAEEYVGLPAIENATTAEIPVSYREYWTQFSSDYYYYYFLNDAEKAFWDKLEEGCITLATTTQDSESIYAQCDPSISQEEMINLLVLFAYCHPQYYFISNRISYYPEGSGSWYGGFLNIYDEFVDGDARMAVTNQFTTKMDLWMTEVEVWEKPEEKAKRAHDIVCQNTDYEFGDFDQSAYSLVCLGQTVCAGYAKTLQMLLNAVGVETITVTSMDHAWNLVQLHGVWYVVDATWNDGEGTDVGYYYYGKSRQTIQSMDTSGSHNEYLAYRDEYGGVQINYTGMLVDAPYDMLSTWYYVTPYFTVDNITYVILNENTNLAERLVKPVGTTEGVPATVSYNGYTYTVIGGTGSAARGDATSLEAFVERMYTVALGRAAEAEGHAFWTNDLLAGKADGAGLASGFILGEEFVGKNYSNEEYVDVLYRTFFNRESSVDPEGCAFWLNSLSVGQSRESVLAGFVNSVEFDALCTSYGISRGILRENGKPINPGICQFSERLYTKILERNSEKEGMEYWSLLIADGACTPATAAKSFFNSSEYLNKKTTNVQYIETLYRTFMGREADEEGLSYWLHNLKNGATREQALDGFATSSEFQQIMREYGL